MGESKNIEYLTTFNHPCVSFLPSFSHHHTNAGVDAEAGGNDDRADLFTQGLAREGEDGGEDSGTEGVGREAEVVMGALER